MKKITLTKEQERLLRQEAENDTVQEDGSIEHTTFERNEREMEVLQGLMNDMDRLLEEMGPAAEKELADKYGYDLWKWYYDKYKAQK